jgi:hypothetical protein
LWLQDYSKEERKDLARMSRLQAPTFGNADRQALTSAAHQRMLEREAVRACSMVLYIPVASYMLAVRCDSPS